MELDGNQPLKCEYWWLSEVSLQKEDCAKNHNYFKKKLWVKFFSHSGNYKSEVIWRNHWRQCKWGHSLPHWNELKIFILTEENRTKQNWLWFCLIEGERKDYDCQTSMRKFLFSLLLGSAFFSQPTRPVPGRDLPQCAHVAEPPRNPSSSPRSGVPGAALPQCILQRAHTGRKGSSMSLNSLLY